MNSQNITLPLSQMLLDRMEKKIVENRPQFKYIKDRYGSLMYFDYVRQKTRMNLNKTTTARKPEAHQVIKQETTRLLGSEIAEEVEKQLKRNDSVSTAEHTGPIGTENMLNAALSHAVPQFDNKDIRFRNSIILSCSGISFSNESSYSRGFQFHPFKADTDALSSIAFFGRSADAQTVMHATPYSSDALNEIKKRLDTFVVDNLLLKNKKDQLEELIFKVYRKPHALSGKDYIDQLTITNYYLWKELFPTYTYNQIPNYVMLSQEKIAIELILKHHLHTDTPINRFIFEKSYRDLTEAYFGDISGAFAKDMSNGTFLFWGIDKNTKLRFQLFPSGDTLINKDKTFIIELTPTSIQNALINGIIYPGILLTFTILAFYYGLILGGGHLQTSYLTQMKEKYAAMMGVVGDSVSQEETLESITDDFVFYRPHLAFLEIGDERVAATALDMHLYQDPAKWKTIVHATKSISVDEFMTILLPVFYKQICPPDQREDELMQITRGSVEKFTGFDKKLPAIGTISLS